MNSSVGENIKLLSKNVNDKESAGNRLEDADKSAIQYSFQWKNRNALKPDSKRKHVLFRFKGTIFSFTLRRSVVIDIFTSGYLVYQIYIYQNIRYSRTFATFASSDYPQC